MFYIYVTESSSVQVASYTFLSIKSIGKNNYTNKLVTFFGATKKLTKSFFKIVWFIKKILQIFVLTKQRHELYSISSSSFLQFGSSEVKVY